MSPTREQQERARARFLQAYNQVVDHPSPVKEKWWQALARFWERVAAKRSQGA